MRNLAGPDSNQGLSITELARKLDSELETLVEEVEQLWIRWCRVAGPIRDQKLYLELGYSTWEEYTQKRFSRPASSINNYLKPGDRLKLAGQDPEEFASVPQSRAIEIAVVAEARGANWSTEEKQKLIEVAKQRKPRGQQDELSIAASSARKTLALDALTRVVLNLSQSQLQLFNQVMDVLEVECRRVAGNPTGESYSIEIKLIDVMIPRFLETEEAKDILRILETESQKGKQ